MVTYFLEPLCFPTQSGSTSLCWASSDRSSGFNCRRIFRHIVNPRGAVILMKGLNFHVALSDITSFRNYKSVPPRLAPAEQSCILLSLFPSFPDSTIDPPLQSNTEPEYMFCPMVNILFFELPNTGLAFLRWTRLFST